MNLLTPTKSISEELETDKVAFNSLEEDDLNWD